MDWTGAFAIVMVFGMPVMIVGLSKYYKHKQLELEARSRGGDPKELESLKAERKQLEARVQNLESIVCSVDLELNQRLNQLAAHQSAAQRLLAAPAQRSAAQPAGGVDVGTSPTVASPMRPPAPESPLHPGQKIANRYSLERELGHGGMGFVYLARDEQLGEKVALKVVSSAMAGDPAEAAERFRREVASARKVTHPNVIRIHDLVEDGTRLLLSMEFVDGMTLAAFLGRRGALGIDEARPLLGQISDGLGAAHAAGVVHRDLKPGNVLVDAAKRVKVIDFGLAKASFLAGMTATGLILGTPEYMAPEQVRGLPCDARTDLYSLGAVAYHVLTGRPPFTGETPIAIGFAHVTEAPRPPRALRPEIPAPVEAAILKALEKDPAKRFSDAAEFKRALG
jgi:serine/threonine-protein kinase